MRSVMAGARGLFVVRILELVLYLASSLFFLLVPAVATAYGSSVLETFEKGNSIAWLVLEVAGLALLVPFARGRAGTSAGGVVGAALVLAAVNLALSVAQIVPELGGPSLLPLSGHPSFERAFAVGSLGLYVAFEICFWVAITRSARAVPAAYGPIFYVALACSTAISLVHVLLPWESYRALFLGTTLGTTLTWVRIGVWAGRGLLVVLVLRRLLGQTDATSEAKPPAPLSPSRDFVVGGLWLGGGVLVTVLSYSAASGGGHYVITTGAIAYGLVRIVRGLLRSGAPSA